MQARVRGVKRSDMQPIAVEQALTSLSCDSNRLCAVTSEQKGICRSADASGWTTLTSLSLQSISLSGGRQWAVDTTGNIVWSHSNDSSSWSRFEIQPTPVVQVSSDGSLLCGLDAEGSVNCTSTQATTASSWFTPFSTKMKAIAVHNDRAAGINAANEAVFHGINDYGNPRQRLEALALDDSFLCVAEQSTLEVSCVARSHETWSKIDAKFAHMALCNATLYGLSRDGTLWATSLTMAEPSVIDVTKSGASAKCCDSRALLS
ncbi:hypothetical protein PINS_up006881 [Pythium insidiosum]|nr:hypothetical protein PINS_up006881 [Pythium insidiosum]